MWYILNKRLPSLWNVESAMNVLRTIVHLNSKEEKEEIILKFRSKRDAVKIVRTSYRQNSNKSLLVVCFIWIHIYWFKGE